MEWRPNVTTKPKQHLKIETRQGYIHVHANLTLSCENLLTAISIFIGALTIVLAATSFETRIQAVEILLTLIQLMASMIVQKR
jgi:hypothetical protein